MFNEFVIAGKVNSLRRQFRLFVHINSSYMYKLVDAVISINMEELPIYKYTQENRENDS